MPPPRISRREAPPLPPPPPPKPPPDPKVEKAINDKKTATTLRTDAKNKSVKAQADAAKAKQAKTAHDKSTKEKGEAQKALDTSNTNYQRLLDHGDSPAGRTPAHAESVKKAKKQVDADQGRVDKAAKTFKGTEEKLTQADTTARDSKQHAVTASDTALQAQKTANVSAKQAGQPEPFPKANEVIDTFDAGSLSKKDQAKLFGTSAPVTPEEAARADITRVKDAVKNSQHKNEEAVAGAEELRKQLALNPDPAYRAALWKESKPQRDAFVDAQVNDRSVHHSKTPELMKSLAQGADMVGPEARKELAGQLLSASKSTSLDGVGEPGRSLKENAKDPAVAKLGGEMVSQLRAAKRYKDADALSNVDPAIKAQSMPSKLDQKLQAEVDLNSVSEERDGLNARQKTLDQETRTTARQTLNDVAKNPKSKEPFTVEPGATKDHAVLVRKDKAGKVTERLEVSFQGDNVKVDSTQVDKKGDARRTVFESGGPEGPSTSTDTRWKQDASTPAPSLEDLAAGKVKGSSYSATKFEGGSNAKQTTTQRTPDGTLTETKKEYGGSDKTDHVNGKFDEFKNFSTTDTVHTTTTVIPPPGAKDEKGKPVKAMVVEGTSYSQGNELRLTKTETKAVDSPVKGDRPAGAEELAKVEKDARGADDAAPTTFVLEKSGDGELNTQTFFEGQPNVTLVTRKKLEGNTVTETTEGRVPKPTDKDKKELVDIKGTTTTTYNDQGLITASHSDQTDPTGVRRVKDFQRTESRNAKGEVEVTERTSGLEEGGDKPKRTYEQALTTAQTPKGPQVVRAESKLTGPEGSAEASIPPEKLTVNGKPIADPQQLKASLPPAQAALGAYAVNGLQEQLNSFSKLSALHAQTLEGAPEAPESAGWDVAGDTVDYGLARLAQEANTTAATKQGKADPANNPKFFSLKPVEEFNQELTLDLDKDQRLGVGAVGGFQVISGAKDVVSGVGDFKKALDEQNKLDLVKSGLGIIDGASGVVEGAELLRFAAKGTGTTISPSGELGGRVNPIKLAEWSGRLSAAVGVVSGGIQVAEGIANDDKYQVALGAVQAGGAVAGYFGTAAAVGAFGGPAGVAVALSVGLVTIGIGSAIERERSHALADQKI
ncbi:hypothetical protein HUA74_07015 [Myxococcus sp. CA051A]|uniref:hypothetical protein n=1 Tax=Myxococcus sp. CA051A TaxID=2741739 RepID=UPI00157AD109|nr:hypothetical protein [Myxococcus sp. CA051A]NTX60407.1 hypothetical protein [Myxococcus sp. CA051A]